MVVDLEVGVDVLVRTSGGGWWVGYFSWQNYFLWLSESPHLMPPLNELPLPIPEGSGCG